MTSVFPAQSSPVVLSFHVHGVSVYRGEWRPYFVHHMTEKILFLYLTGFHNVLDNGLRQFDDDGVPLWQPLHLYIFINSVNFS